MAHHTLVVELEAARTPAAITSTVAALLDGAFMIDERFGGALDSPDETGFRLTRTGHGVTIRVELYRERNRWSVSMGEDRVGMVDLRVLHHARTGAVIREHLHDLHIVIPATIGWLAETDRSEAVEGARASWWDALSSPDG